MNWSKIYFLLCGILLCVVCVTAGASEPKKTQFTITGLKQPEKDNVKHRLNDLYAHPTKHEISKEILQKQVAKALMPYGYFNPVITVTPPSKNHPGTVHVIPGKKLVITQLTVYITGMGRDNPEIVHALQTLPIQQGAPFNSILYQEAKNKLNAAAEHQGYLNAKFETANVLINKQQNTAQIALHFETGQRSYFGRIHFGTGFAKPTPHVKNALPLPRFSTILDILNPTGSTHSLFSKKRIVLSNKLLYRYVPFQYGSPYSNDEILDLTSHLKASGYFKAVDVTPKDEYEHARYVPLNVYLEPVERFRYSISGGYGTDTGARGRVGLHIVPVNAMGHKIDIVGQGSSNQNAAQMKYSIPGKDPVHDQFNINGGFNNLNYVSGHSQAGRMSLVYEHVMPNYQRIFSLNGLREAFRYDKKSPSERTIIYPKATLSWREVSDPLFSPSGYNLTVTGFAASRAVLSSISVSEFTADARAALTIDFLRTRFYGHVIGGINQVRDVYSLPLSLALLLGGPEDMKGYSFNSIGPGKRLAYGGIEVQKETLDTWYVIGFIDKGTVYDPNPRLVQYDIGIGLMWRSPVGPIKMALAQPTDRNLRAMPDTGFRFVANMGPDI